MHEEKSCYSTEAGRKLVREFEEYDQSMIERWLQYSRQLLGDSPGDDESSTSAA